MTTALTARVEVEKSFPDFLRAVQISEPVAPGELGGGTIPFALWPHLIAVSKALETRGNLAVLKSKQIGLSWTLAAYALWTALYHDSARVLLFSMGERESRELLAKVRFIYDHLPDHLQVPLKGEGNSQELLFPSRSSQIMALPATRTVGVGFTASLVVMDEADFFEYFAEAYDIAARPTIAAGGQIVIVSTANPIQILSPFRAIYQQAERLGFRRLFFDWAVRPGRDAAWYAKERLAYLDQARFEKNYPRTPEEALAPAQASAAFSLATLTAMQADCRPPVSRHRGVGNIWQGYQVGKRYIAASDTGHGVERDFSVTVVLDVATGYVVADVMTNLLDPDAFALESLELLGIYQSPVWAPEDNEWGGRVITLARMMRYPRLYNRDETGKKEEWGWRTDERNRWDLWADLISAIQSRLLTIPSVEGLAQFFTVVRNVDKGGRPEAMAGAHDDYPMALGIAWQLRKYGVVSGLSGEASLHRQSAWSGRGVAAGPVRKSARFERRW